jgi:PHD/YefM family antitoxin component YafN of YafNO toxin-antitoxin module
MNVPTRPDAVFTSRAFNQDTAGAKRAARKGPVIVTDRGKPAYVLVSIEEFRRLEQRHRPGRKSGSLADVLEQKEGGDFDFAIPEFKDGFAVEPAERD